MENRKLVEAMRVPRKSSKDSGRGKQENQKAKVTLVKKSKERAQVSPKEEESPGNTKRNIVTRLQSIMGNLENKITKLNQEYSF